ncbi:MAG: hypothetical protein UT13_C0001G0585 [Candidatus Pacebacteria bacterium GW2011_GWF2_38_9]|nr:MAG: hypothetical protein US01_C0001G0602 [candidate division TM6 bacterium GW2011_GWF2_28_16]KKQ08217.1 MAG: hypothetical protein US20_C0022G0005 [Candidatus Pacebacteria bacterium GW2011_GWF1_36_5]KKQ88938.1 MAG: hypothetical protein UT13_C0001G0585 [Candidatus Pacebacteria bacterium GW2011_GWF2_38_9]HAZ73114.1 EF-P lysine aminoacylase GenX [Candidatus Paceibacterota bacterium]
MKKNWQKIKETPSLAERFLMREKVIDAVRLFFKGQAFHEVETPLLASCPGAEPYLNLFETSLELPDGQKKQAYLLTSPEYSMKKLLAAGLGNIFQICKTFRNQESLGGKHNPEFTILEFYRANANYLDVMNDFEAMMAFICQALSLNAKKVVYQGCTFDLTSPYLKFSVAELFEKYLHLNADQLLNLEFLRQKAQSLGYDLSGLESLSADLAWEELYNQLFLNEIESKLAAFNKPVIVYDYPTPQAALARKKASDPRFAERFEVYLAGMELGNAFGELIDPKEQKKRLEADMLLRKELGKKDHKIDQDFLTALEFGLPESSGMAVGIDRLIMLFADVSNIDQTLFFPASEAFLD